MVFEIIPTYLGRGSSPTNPLNNRLGPISSPPVIPADPEPSHTDTFDVEYMEVTTKDGTFNAGNRLIGRSV